MPTLSLVCKAYAGAWNDELMPQLVMSFLLFWPKNYGELVVVLDDEDDAEHFAGALLEQVSDQISVVFEHLTFKPQEVFLGKDYEARIGYDRQMYMHADLYTQAQIVVVIDADAAFIMAVTPSNLFAEDGRPLMGVICHQRGYYMQSTIKALGKNFTYLDGMTRFPVVVKREHFALCRHHIMTTMGKPTFEAAWRELLGVGGVSEMTWIANYLWHFQHDEYDWHIQVEFVKPGQTIPGWLLGISTYLRPMQHITNHKLIQHGGFSSILKSPNLKAGYCLAADSMHVDRPFCHKVDTNAVASHAHFAPDGDFSSPFVTNSTTLNDLTSQQVYFMKGSGVRFRQRSCGEIIVKVPPI